MNYKYSPRRSRYVESQDEETVINHSETSADEDERDYLLAEDRVAWIDNSTADEYMEAYGHSAGLTTSKIFDDLPLLPQDEL